MKQTVTTKLPVILTAGKIKPLTHLQYLYAQSKQNKKTIKNNLSHLDSLFSKVKRFWGLQKQKQLFCSAGTMHIYAFIYMYRFIHTHKHTHKR